MSLDREPDLQVGYGGRATVVAGDAVNGARVADPPGDGTGDAVNGARVTPPPTEGTGDAVNGARAFRPPTDGTGDAVNGARVSHPPADGPRPPRSATRIRASRRADADVSVHRSTRLLAALLLPIFVLVELPRVLFRSGGATLRRVGRACLSHVARFGRWTADRLRPAGRRLMVAARAAASVFAVAGRVLVLTGRGLRVLARAVRAAVVPLGRAAVTVLTWLDRGFRVLARAVRAVVVPLGRAAVTVLTWLGRALVAAARAVRVVLVPVSAIAWWLCVRVARGLRAAGAALVVVLRVAALGVGAGQEWFASRVGRIATWLWPVLVSTSAPLCHAVAAAGRTVGRGLWNARRVVAAMIARTGRSLVRRLDALGLAGGLALGAAGKRARRLAGTTRGADLAPVAGNEVTTAGTVRRPAPPRPNGPGSHAGGAVRFSVDVSQNAYLGVGTGVVDALITVSAIVERPASGSATPELAEVILLDCSSSMNHPSRKMAAARLATQAAIDCLRDGVAFAVVRCTGTAEVVYPTDATMAIASTRTRREAKAVAAGLEAGGGTAFGPWLTAARDLFRMHPHSIHHALLLTDGRDEGESAGDLSAALDECAGEFQCDCRGVGTDWHVVELRQVTTALLGTVDIIPDPAGMAADFRSITEWAMSRVVDGVSLRIRTPLGASLEFVRQVAPSIEELCPAPPGDDVLAEEFVTGAWGREVRCYLLRVRVAPGREGTEMLAARVHLMVDGTARGEARVLATWTGDATLAGYIDPQVARATGQADLAAAVREGLAAKRRGDESGATRQLGTAVRLAAETASDNISALLANVVDVEDAATGTVTLRRRASAVDEMLLDTRSAKTVGADACAADPCVADRCE